MLPFEDDCYENDPRNEDPLETEAHEDDFDGDEDFDGDFDEGPFDDDESGGIRFANPGSALRAASEDNPRNLPCPNCKKPNRLTPADRAQGYQCDDCAQRAEFGGDY